MWFLFLKILNDINRGPPKIGGGYSSGDMVPPESCYPIFSWSTVIIPATRTTNIPPPCVSAIYFTKKSEQKRTSLPPIIPIHEEIPRKPQTKRAKLKYRIWKSLEKLRKPEIKFAVKVGLGAVLLALPAFTPRWRDVYTHWRGEWALLSYFVVIASSVGATTSTGMWRFIPLPLLFSSRVSRGRVASVVVLMGWWQDSGDFDWCGGGYYFVCLFKLGNGSLNGRWELSPANPYVLSIVGALFSTGCFYLIANTANWQPFGRFILLTYNLVTTPLPSVHLSHLPGLYPGSFSIYSSPRIWAITNYSLRCTRIHWH